MSDNIFHTDPIFVLPIDYEEDFKNSSKEIQNEKICNNQFEKHTKKSYKKKKTTSEDENSNENTSSGKENDYSSESSKDKDKNQKKIFVREKAKENGDEVIVFSTSVNDRHIKSMTNSSKIYVNEIFKQNWKLKSRRLITKLKKKLIKEYKNKCFKELTEVNNNHIKNSSFKNNIMNSNNMSSNIPNCNNNFIYNNDQKSTIYTNIQMSNNNNLSDYLDNSNLVNYLNNCANININFNQYNNNYQIVNNSINQSQELEIELYKKYLLAKLLIGNQ